MKRALFLIMAVLAVLLIVGSVIPPPSGVLKAQQTTGQPFSCIQTVVTVTALTAFSGDCANVPSDVSLYVTDVIFSSNSAGIAADSFPTLKYGVSTATVTVFWGSFLLSTANPTVSNTFRTPIKIPAGNQLYFVNSTAGSKFVIVNGYRGGQ